MLAARPARPRRPKLDLGERNREPRRDPEDVDAARLAVGRSAQHDGTRPAVNSRPWRASSSTSTASSTSRGSRSTARPRRWRRSASRGTAFASSRTTPRAREPRSPRSCRAIGFELDEGEIETTPLAAAKALAGSRVLALDHERRSGPTSRATSSSSTRAPDAVLLGGADESEETGRVFAWTNLNRAFAALRDGARLVCLHKNRWWQTSAGPLLDAGAFVTGLEYAAGVEAEVVGKPSRAYFEAALAELGAEAGETVMVGDDVESDVGGAKAVGMHGVLVRTGKFTEDALAAQIRSRTPSSTRSATCRSGSREDRDRPDRDPAHRAGARPRRVSRALLHAKPSGPTATHGRNPAQHYAARFAGKEAIGKALGCGVNFTWREIEIAGRPKPGVSLSGWTRGWAERVRAGRDRPLDDPLEGARSSDLRRRRCRLSRSTPRPRCAPPRRPTTARRSTSWSARARPSRTTS